MVSLWVSLQVLVVAFAGALLVNAASNMRLLRAMGTYPWPERWPRVSVLVPARNEEERIAVCVGSLLRQEYPDFEVLVLDDDSEDLTGEVLAGLAARDGRLRVLRGRGLPEGWMGKNWACHQLAQAATGELLLFTDADTRHDPGSLRDGVAALAAQDADFLSAFPRQEVGSWPERLLVPVLTWSFALFLPLRLAYRSSRPDLSIAIGQYMLFRRRAYEAIGGYEAIREELIDDLALGRLCKARGQRWRLADGSSRVRCRMYRGWREVFQGVGKSLFPGFQYNISLFVPALLWGAFLALQPLAVLLLWLGGVAFTHLSLWLAAAAVGASLLLVGTAYPRFGFPGYLALLYPVTVLAMLVAAVFSVVMALSGRYTWKGRPLERRRIRWW